MQTHIECVELHVLASHHPDTGVYQITASWSGGASVHGKIDVTGRNEIFGVYTLNKRDVSNVINSRDK